jgi:hypothetical protein
MARAKLTDRKLKALKRKGKRYDVMDTEVSGFGVRVSEIGQRTFILVARYPGSSNPNTRRALGEYPTQSLQEARTKARKWRDLISRPGKTPRPRMSARSVRNYASTRPPSHPLPRTLLSGT